MRPVDKNNCDNFISEINEFTNQIQQGVWNERPPLLSEKIFHLFRKQIAIHHEDINSHNELRGDKYKNALQSLVEAMKTMVQSFEITDLISKIGLFLNSKCDALGNRHNLDGMPSSNDKEVEKSLKEFKKLISEEVPNARKLLASWINYSEIPLSGLKLSKDELIDYAPYLTFLNIDTDELSQSDIEELLPRFVALKKLILSTDSLTDLKSLPANLENLNCSFCNELINIDSLNEKLINFDSSSCEKLSKLPMTLPSSLKNFKCPDCEYVKKLPVLNEGLISLDISRTGIEEISNLPSTLQQLIIFECSKELHIPTEILPAACRIIKQDDGE